VGVRKITPIYYGSAYVNSVILYISTIMTMLHCISLTCLCLQLLHSDLITIITRASSAQNSVLTCILGVYSLCCQCGTPIEPNPANMCVACLRSQVDITEGIPKQATLYFCKGCER